ncbi:formylglycine-generating enzyme family protein [Propionicicella superfundia]|uniref:formylglycine-generating enzyme family protein n=1 Tax=Propionicicella superfundia TaxID=348582 RepID=UPI00048E162E|nr:SUMF1/EgtB/PvdO family nonheme iron enzyme [Propionicicella superfundia]
MPPDLVSLPAGSVSLWDARRKTRRMATLRGFALGRTPVTWAQYSSVLGIAIPEGEVGDAPAHSVSWLDAASWCNALSGGCGLSPVYRFGGGGPRWDVSADGFRLPTEAEWEWACRAGTDGPRYGSLADVAWTAADGVEGAQSVGRKVPNGFGLFDMLGNVWEWCWDHIDPARYADYRVLRGGGWADKHWSVRASVRRGSAPVARLDDVGFRVARGAVGAAEEHAAQGWSDQVDRERAGLGGPVPLGWTSLRP